MTQLLLAQRLRHEMQQRSMTAADLAKRADVKPTFLYDVLSGKSANPSTIKLDRVAAVLGMNLTDLVGARATSSARAAQENDDYVAIIPLRSSLRTRQDDFMSMPMLFHRQWLRHVLRVEPSQLAHLTIEGDHMAPTLSARDMVLVDTNQKIPSPPGIFAIELERSISVHRMEMTQQSGEKRVVIKYDNPAYNSQSCVLSQLNILGRIIWCTKGL